MADRPPTDNDHRAEAFADVREDPQRRLSREEVSWLMHGPTAGVPFTSINENNVDASATHETSTRQAFALPELRPGGTKSTSRGSHETEIRVELGRRTISTEEAASLAPGELVSLEDAGQFVSLYAGERFIATGELLMQDNCLCVRVIEMPGDAFLGISGRIF